MSSLYFLFPTLLVILVSFLFVRGAAIALMMTGLEKKKARFQALSAFSGTGYTTKEAELVINHPMRRKIMTWLMIMGNAGVATVIVTATSSMAASRGYQLPINIIVLVLGIFLIYKIMTGRKIIKKWENFIERKLVKSPAFEEASTEDLLHFLEGYGVVKKILSEDSPLVGSSISESGLSEKGALVLGIERGKNWIPIPRAREIIERDEALEKFEKEKAKEIEKRKDQNRKKHQVEAQPQASKLAPKRESAYSGSPSLQSKKGDIQTPLWSQQQEKSLHTLCRDISPKDKALHREKMAESGLSLG